MTDEKEGKRERFCFLIFVGHVRIQREGSSVMAGVGREGGGEGVSHERVGYKGIQKRGCALQYLPCIVMNGEMLMIMCMTKMALEVMITIMIRLENDG